jgi:hypothetical protein
MRILREVTAVSLAFLSALLPVQEALGKKVSIGFMNVKKDTGHVSSGWISVNSSNPNNPKAMELFKSEKGKEAFNIFLKAAKDKCGIMKIINLPDPPAGFVRHIGKVRGDREIEFSPSYINLKTGKYRSDYFDREDVGFCPVPFEVDSRSYWFDVFCFDVEEEEAAEINESLIFNLFREPSAPSTPISEGN